MQQSERQKPDPDPKFLLMMDPDLKFLLMMDADPKF
jgi:hypothetical protein